MTKATKYCDNSFCWVEQAHLCNLMLKRENNDFFRFQNVLMVDFFDTFSLVCFCCVLNVENRITFIYVREMMTKEKNANRTRSSCSLGSFERIELLCKFHISFRDI